MVLRVFLLVALLGLAYARLHVRADDIGHEGQNRDGQRYEPSHLARADGKDREDDVDRIGDG